ncbi:MAG: GNAT family N-acetyltransferase [Desulfobulbaceae bacterium]|nr:GNAT family N-acetyltransferase [Desulfobulbaceae bacterium]
MSGVIIRRAQPADMEFLLHLLRSLFSIEKDFTFNPVRQRAGLAMMLVGDRAILLVAEKETRVIGMCCGQLMVSTAEGGLSLLVEDVVVDRPWRNKGVGTALLTALQDWATKNNVLRLQLLADRSNTAALKFYHTLKWRKTELICLYKR